MRVTVVRASEGSVVPALFGIGTVEARRPVQPEQRLPRLQGRRPAGVGFARSAAKGKFGLGVGVVAGTTQGNARFQSGPLLRSGLFLGFVVGQRDGDGRVLVSLLRGSLRALTGLIGKANNRNVGFATATATIGVRGTAFDWRNTGQGTAAIAGQSLAHHLGDFLAESDVQVEAVLATELSGFHLRLDMRDTLIVAVSQSGTTTDTNRTVDLARGRGASVVAIVNRRGSDLTDSDVSQATGKTGTIALASGAYDPTNDAGLLPIDLDVPHVGRRGGSIRKRFAGQLEGVDPGGLRPMR